MKRYACLVLAMLTLGATNAFSQTNISFTNPTIDSVLRDLYNPFDYASSQPVTGAANLVQFLENNISEDSLLAYLTDLSSFGNRNTGSDTTSATFGIGAARRYALNKFNEFDADAEGRLLTGYLQFNQVVCGMGLHRNVVAVLPGSNPSGRGFVLIEGHMDSRCDDNCDSQCLAYGADDNGSGSVLVMELARVMSKMTFDETIVFMLTTGEEQGLIGAGAFANYCNNENIPIQAVYNHDIVGGIYCGNTASPPGCPGAGDVDSLNVRLYSFGNYNSQWKQLARYTKLQYQEMLKPQVAVPMTINIMTGEDRVGRGGDHIPFRQRNYISLRMTSANEHGNGSPNAGYTDRQHTSSDSLGIDLNMDGVIDSFYVDFNYLARNTRISGTAAAMTAISPPPITAFTGTAVPGGIAIQVNSPLTTPTYRVAVRTTSNDWDSLYTLSQATDTIYGLAPGITIFSMAQEDTNGVESLFRAERNVNVPTPTGVLSPGTGGALELLQNHPNPFDEQTIISVRRNAPISFEEAYILIADIRGKEIERIPLTLEADLNEVRFVHGFHAKGTYVYSLIVDGETIGSKKMILE